MSACVSPDGARVAVTTHRRLVVYDASSGAALDEDDRPFARQLQFLADSRRLLVLGADKRLELRDTDRHEVLWRCAHCQEFVLAPGEATMAAWNVTGRIALLESSTGHVQRALAGHPEVSPSAFEPFDCFAQLFFSPDGQTLTSEVLEGSPERGCQSVRRGWNLASGAPAPAATGDGEAAPAPFEAELVVRGAGGLRVREPGLLSRRRGYVVSHVSDTAPRSATSPHFCTCVFDANGSKLAELLLPDAARPVPPVSALRAPRMELSAMIDGSRLGLMAAAAAYTVVAFVSDDKPGGLPQDHLSLWRLSPAALSAAGQPSPWEQVNRPAVDFQRELLAKP